MFHLHSCRPRQRRHRLVGVEHLGIDVVEIAARHQERSPCPILAHSVVFQPQLLGEPTLVLFNAAKFGTAVRHHAQPVARHRFMHNPDAQFCQMSRHTFLIHLARVFVHVVDVEHKQAARHCFVAFTFPVGEEGLPSDGRQRAFQLAPARCHSLGYLCHHVGVDSVAKTLPSAQHALHLSLHALEQAELHYAASFLFLLCRRVAVTASRNSAIRASMFPSSSSATMLW